MHLSEGILVVQPLTVALLIEDDSTGQSALRLVVVELDLHLRLGTEVHEEILLHIEDTDIGVAAALHGGAVALVTVIQDKRIIAFRL